MGAGIVGAACAFYATAAGLDVTVIERAAVSAGTTGAGEGNVLVSDKRAGPELSMALRSAQLWAELDDQLGAGSFELERKGGIVVAENADALGPLRELCSEQSRHGVDSEPLSGEQLSELEPHLAPGLAGGAFYPADAQVQPMLAAARMLQAAVLAGTRLHLGAEVTGLLVRHGRVSGVQAGPDVIAADLVNDYSSVTNVIAHYNEDHTLYLSSLNGKWTATHLTHDCVQDAAAGGHHGVGGTVAWGWIVRGDQRR